MDEHDKGLTPDEKEALDGLAEALVCSQCGFPFAHRACGPTHALIAADPRQHRLIQPLLRRGVRDAVL